VVSASDLKVEASVAPAVFERRHGVWHGCEKVRGAVVVDESESLSTQSPISA